MYDQREQMVQDMKKSKMESSRLEKFFPVVLNIFHC